MNIKGSRLAYAIESNYGYGWDMECKAYDLKEAKELLKVYQDNCKGLVRIKRRFL